MFPGVIYTTSAKVSDGMCDQLSGPGSWASVQQVTSRGSGQGIQTHARRLAGILLRGCTRHGAQPNSTPCSVEGSCSVLRSALMVAEAPSNPVVVLDGVWFVQNMVHECHDVYGTGTPSPRPSISPELKGPASIARGVYERLEIVNHGRVSGAQQKARGRGHAQDRLTSVE